MKDLIDTFSNRLNTAMRIRNIKPVELSEKTGIDKSKISSYMSGRYKAKQDGIYLLAKALDVSETWLMGMDVPMERIEVYADEWNMKKDNIEDTPEIRAIARDVAKLKPEKKELFKSLLKQMSDEADEALKK